MGPSYVKSTQVIRPVPLPVLPNAVDVILPTTMVTRDAAAVENRLFRMASPTSVLVAPKLMSTRSPAWMSAVVDASVISAVAPDDSASYAYANVVEYTPLNDTAAVLPIFTVPRRFTWFEELPRFSSAAPFARTVSAAVSASLIGSTTAAAPVLPDCSQTPIPSSTPATRSPPKWTYPFAFVDRAIMIHSEEVRRGPRVPRPHPLTPGRTAPSRLSAYAPCTPNEPCHHFD